MDKVQKPISSQKKTGPIIWGYTLYQVLSKTVW
jgi:hypothetical protein